ncbi:MAG: glycosyltransferase [Bacteroidetes bacterium]|nr:glycosyltransferase [Bacteroidota bacterium]
MASFKKNKVHHFYNSSDNNLPSIGIIIAAYNEEKVIKTKIHSILKTNYPLSKINIYIGSDASSDNTNNIVLNFSKTHHNIHLTAFESRTGKAGIINKLSNNAVDDILILTDANVFFEESTLFNLIKYFKNGRVGLVAANIKKLSKTSSGISEQEISYMSYENKIKLNESKLWGSIFGAEGGCYAIRKELYQPIPKNYFMDDFFITLNVIKQKYYTIFCENAVCFEDVLSNPKDEFKRKVRISIGNFQNLNYYKRLLLFFWRGSAFAFMSHKILRWLTPFLIILLSLSAFALSIYSNIFLLLSIFIILSIAISILTINQKFKSKPLLFFSHFLYMNLALLKGFFIYVKGVKSSIWQPPQRNVQ